MFIYCYVDCLSIGQECLLMYEFDQIVCYLIQCYF